MSAQPTGILSDDELEAVLARAFLATGGALTRDAECLLAGLCARHVGGRPIRPYRESGGGITTGERTRTGGIDGVARLGDAAAP